MDAKIFTVAEANAALQNVIKPAMDRLDARVAAIETLRTDVQIGRLVAETGASATNPDRAQLARLERRRREIEAEIREDIEAIHATGGVIKDLRAGLVDFFSILDGKLVFLCWRRGEDQVRFWHKVEEGFRSRRPLGARLKRKD
jgi:hypothetical protein